MAKQKLSNLAIHRELGRGEFRRHYGSSRSPGCGEVTYWCSSKPKGGGKMKKIFWCPTCGKHVTVKNHLGDRLDIRTIPTMRDRDS